MKPPSGAVNVLLLCGSGLVGCTGHGNCRPKVSRSSIRKDYGGVGAFSAGFCVAASVISVTCFRISLVASFKLSCTTLFTKLVISVVRPVVEGDAAAAGAAAGGGFRTGEGALGGTFTDRGTTGGAFAG